MPGSPRGKHLGEGDSGIGRRTCWRIHVQLCSSPVLLVGTPPRYSPRRDQLMQCATRFSPPLPTKCLTLYVPHTPPAPELLEATPQLSGANSKAVHLRHLSPTPSACRIHPSAITIRSHSASHTTYATIHCEPKTPRNHNLFGSCDSTRAPLARSVPTAAQPHPRNEMVLCTPSAFRV